MAETESASWVVQKGIVAALKNDAVLLDLLRGERIYDQVPSRQAYPFLVYGQSSARDWSTSTELGCEHLLSLHVWSRSGGKKEIYQIMDRVRQVLSSGSVSLSGHNLVDLRCLSEEARIEAGGEVYHGILRLRAITEPKTEFV